LTTNQILTGVGLILALAVGSQVLASRLRIPAIIVLLPAGFITALLLLTDEDDFNALASVLLTETVAGRVYRLAPPQRSHGVVAPYIAGEILFADAMTRSAVTERYQDGGRFVVHGTGGVLPAGQDLLFVVRADGQLTPVTQTSTPTPQPGDTLVSLGPALAAQPADPGHRDLPEVERR
jgi:hypothetical protein